jgi:hypothetical protein
VVVDVVEDEGKREVDVVGEEEGKGVEVEEEVIKKILVVAVEEVLVEVVVLEEGAGRVEEVC